VSEEKNTYIALAENWAPVFQPAA